MGFWSNSFKGVLRVARKIEGSPFSCFIAFLCDHFLDLTPLPHPPLCASMVKTLSSLNQEFLLLGQTSESLLVSLEVDMEF
jgi:hypothetical protein